MQHLLYCLPGLLVVCVKVEDVPHSPAKSVLGEELQVLHHVHGLAGRVRVLNLAFVGHRPVFQQERPSKEINNATHFLPRLPQLRKAPDESPELILLDRGSVSTQHGQLRLQGGIVDGVAGEEVAHRPEEVVPQKGETCDRSA